jgi:hypothetical protein
MENKELYFACEKVRIFLITKEGMNQENKLGKGSIIGSLISAEDFDSLFKNPDWLMFLEAAGNVNCFHNWRIKKDLKTIISAYPKTKALIGTTGD